MVVFDPSKVTPTSSSPPSHGPLFPYEPRPLVTIKPPQTQPHPPLPFPKLSPQKALLAKEFLAARRTESMKKTGLPAGTKLLPPKGGEKLSSAETDRHGNLRKLNYTHPRVSLNSRVTLDGARARPEQIRFVQPQEAAERMEAPKQGRMTMAELRAEYVFIKNFLNTEHKNWSATTRDVRALDEEIRAVNARLTQRIKVLESLLDKLIMES